MRLIRGFELSVVIVVLGACASSPKGLRAPASSDGAGFEEMLTRTGLLSYRANLHSHHFMKVSKVESKGNALIGDGEENSGGNQKFPFDDGRPMRRNTGGAFLYADSELKPESADHFKNACDYGRKEGELDILFVTPHTKNGEMSGEADTGRDAFVIRHAMLDVIGRESGDSYYCGLGQEASSISAGNHINILGHFPRDVSGGTKPFFFPSGEFDRFYPQVRARAEAGERVILEFNHPDTARDLWWGDLSRIGRKPLKQALNDYGLDDYAPAGCVIRKKLGNSLPEGCSGSEPEEISWETLRDTYAAIRKDAADRFRLIEVVSPDGATSNPGVDFKRVHSRVDADGALTEAAGLVPTGLVDYIFYLNMGFQLGPTANQDNHHMNWGSAVASRTGLLAASLSEKSVFDALEARRTFASEDRNARVLLTADGVLMGGEVATASDTVTLEMGYSDPDSSDSTALARIFRYREGEKLRFDKATPLAPLRWVSFDSSAAILPLGAPAQYLPREGDPDVLVIRSGETRRIQLPADVGLQYVFVELTQAGDQDKLWTAPVWIRKATP